jgi:hypothetical protein
MAGCRGLKVLLKVAVLWKHDVGLDGCFGVLWGGNTRNTGGGGFGPRGGRDGGRGRPGRAQHARRPCECCACSPLMAVRVGTKSLVRYFART